MMQSTDQLFMRRCLQLAALGKGNVEPNPLVGAVLVFNNRIIGEGYHKKYGQTHAEVNCIQSVKQASHHLIEKSVLYVSLEPCDHFGKTPPCSDLIIQHKIPKVVIGCKDSFTKVDGKGIEKLRQNGVEVVVGVLEEACLQINKSFFLFHSLKRPFIILKWAQSADKKIASATKERLMISNTYSDRLVHKWRHEVQAILVGRKTVMADDPKLTNRLWSGKSPVRLIIDPELKLHNDHKIFENTAPVIIFNLKKSNLNFNELLKNQVYYLKIMNKQKMISGMLAACYKLNITSILVEGGTETIQMFINQNVWDEARIITNTTLQVGKGLNAPEFFNQKLISDFSMENDNLNIYYNKSYN